jgi:hypothetical protein
MTGATRQLIDYGKSTRFLRSLFEDIGRFGPADVVG